MVLPTFAMEYGVPSRMFGAFFPGSSLTILPVCGAALPVSAACAAGTQAPRPATVKATSSTNDRSFRTPTIPPYTRHVSGSRPQDMTIRHSAPEMPHIRRTPPNRSGPPPGVNPLFTRPSPRLDQCPRRSTGVGLAASSRSPRARVVHRSSTPPSTWKGARRSDQLLGVPVGVAGAAGQSRALGVDRLEPPERTRDPPGRHLDGRVDDHLHVVLPADRQVFLEYGDRVEVGRAA